MLAKQDIEARLWNTSGAAWAREGQERRCPCRQAALMYGLPTNICDCLCGKMKEQRAKQTDGIHACKQKAGLFSDYTSTCAWS